MILTPQQKQDILLRVRQSFPNWDGFTNPEFIKEEITYKQRAVTLLRDTLGAEEMQQKLNAGMEDEIIKRLEKVGHSTNLLFQTLVSAKCG